MDASSSAHACQTIHHAKARRNVGKRPRVADPLHNVFALCFLTETHYKAEPSRSGIHHANQSLGSLLEITFFAELQHLPSTSLIDRR